MPHVAEKDEALDYDRFYTFPATTHDLTRAAGRRTWQLLHGLADHYPCPPCKGIFQTLVSGIHDMVNVHLDKPVHNPRRFEEFLGMVHEVEKTYRKRPVAHQVVS